MPDFIDINQQNFSFFGRGSRITGKFNLRGATHLSSHIEGDINMEDDANLCIERDGKIKGNINCNDIEIYGQFQGVLKSKGKIIVYPSAVIQGEINSKNLVIYPGATLNVDAHAGDE